MTDKRLAEAEDDNCGEDFPWEDNLVAEPDDEFIDISAQYEEDYQ